MFELILLLILWLYLFLLLILIAAYAAIKAPINLKQDAMDASLPEVSILVPARNEEQNIIACLQSLLNLDYPKEKLHIYIGNDQSTDQTAELVAAFALEHPHFKLVNITQTLGTARAKGNVLANLLSLVQTEIIFVTDADICVNPQWVKRLLPRLTKDGFAMVSGTTLVDGEKMFHKWQGLEWYFGTGYIAAFEQLGIPTTAVGNNMAFTKAAYMATGGYENMPFSVTEDFQLYDSMRRQGFKTYNESHAQSVNLSKAQPTILGMLHQRKRWLMGARALPWYWMMIFGLQGLFYPAIFVLLFIHLKLAIKIWLIKVVLYQLFLWMMQRRLGQRLDLLAQLSFECYSVWSTLSMMLFYVGAGKMVWKDRSY
jgi:1,2-diacylglycerol 3-beta-glucosyltransferase